LCGLSQCWTLLLQSLLINATLLIMRTQSTLSVRAFPPDLNKQAKILAVKQGVSLRQFVIDAVKAAVTHKAVAK